MKHLLTQHQLTAILSGVCLLIPVAYADQDISNLASIEQVEVIHNNRDIEAKAFNKSDEVLLTQLGDNNYADVGVNGSNNQINLIQEGNKNKGDIQINGDGNKLLALQNGGDVLSFGLKIDGDNRTYTLTQEKR